MAETGIEKGTRPGLGFAKHGALTVHQDENLAKEASSL